MVQKAQKQPMSEEMIRDRMLKTGNTPFVFEELSVDMEPDIFIPVGALNQLRRVGLEQLEHQVLEKYYRKSAEIYQEEPKKIPVRKNRTPELHVLVEEREQFEKVLKQPDVSRIYLDIFKAELGHDIRNAHEYGKELYISLPYILRKNTAQQLEQIFPEVQKYNPDGYLVRNLEEIRFLQKMNVDMKQIQTDYGMYVFSTKAQEALKTWGIDSFTLPVELNRGELSNLDCQNGEMILYGHQPLMISAQCLHKNTAGCDKKKGVSYLKDRYGKLFPVKNNCNECYNVIYNISPLVLMHHRKEIQKLAPKAIRLSFTIETKQKMEQVFAAYQDLFIEGKKISPDQYFSDYTNGHFKRGVE